MITVFRSAWALLLGMFLLQIGNGLQGSLMGVRGAIEGFSTFQLSLIGSAYFLGFLGGSSIAPKFIARVGHVRVFAALGSLISAIVISFPIVTDPYVWMVLRVLIGASLSGVYVTAESWLNNSATNETRGQSLSAYMLMQMFGLVAAQGILSVGDPSDWLLFVIPSILVSLSFAPILLSAQPTPVIEEVRSMSLKKLYKTSPFASVSMLLMGAVFAGQFAMAAVYATEVGLNLQQLSAFISAIFIGAIFLQYPIGYMSDRMDRRILIVGAAGGGAVVALAGAFLGQNYYALLAVAALSGGLAQPMYALLIAYTNDYLDPADMPAASGAMIFTNGIGAVTGPPLMGLLMAAVGPSGFWLFLSGVLVAVTAYGVFRMTQRVSAYTEETDYDSVPYATIYPGAVSSVAFSAAQEYYADAAEEMANDDVETSPEDSKP